MRFAKLTTIVMALILSSVFGLVGCGKKCNPEDIEAIVYTNGSCPAGAASTASVPGYNIYVSSGFPIATGVGIISRWSSAGSFIDIAHDFATSTGFMPQAVTFQIIDSQLQMLMMSYNGTYGEISRANTDGTSFVSYLSNATALAAGTRRFIVTTDGGYLATRTAGVERFNSAKQRLGAAAKYATSGTCTLAAGTSAAQMVLSGVDYVVASNGAATPNNKLNLYNGSTGACISGAAPAGPAATMWPVDMYYSVSYNKLFVLYYPFTAATTNAQIWSFDVTGATINNGILLYNDIYGDIATISATPGALSSSIVHHRLGTDDFVLVGTTNNSVLKFVYDGSTTLTKVGTTPLIYQNSLVRSISNVTVLNY